MLKEDTETLGLGMVVKLQTELDSETSRSNVFVVISTFTAVWVSLLFPGEQLQVLEWDEFKGVYVWQVQPGA